MRVATCRCGNRIRYAHGLNDTGRAMWSKLGPPRCCGAVMVEVIEGGAVQLVDRLALPD